MYSCATMSDVVVGASSGIGRATAVLFSRLGANLTVTGRNGAALEETIKLCDEKSKCYPVVGDLTIESDVENLVKSTVNKLGKLDVLVCVSPCYDVNL